MTEPTKRPTPRFALGTRVTGAYKAKQWTGTVVHCAMGFASDFYLIDLDDVMFIDGERRIQIAIDDLIHHIDLCVEPA